MAVFQHSVVQAAAATSTDPVAEQSLRFEDGDSASLERTVTSAGSSRKFTLSLWAKRGKLGALTPLFSAAASGYEDILLFNSDDTLILYARSGNDLTAQTSAKYRDTSAFYHIVVSIDTEQSTASDRLKIYVNGTLQSYTGTPTEDYDYTAFNAAETHYLGFYAGSSYYYDGTFADVYFLDGTAKVASDFAEENSDGQWVPKATSFSSGDYGTNGVHLLFGDATYIGEDTSGEGNDWTESNVASDDVLLGSPDSGDNYATLNPLSGDETSTFYEGNLKGTLPANNGAVMSNIALPSSGKWYCECWFDSAPGYPIIGVGRMGMKGWASSQESDAQCSVYWNNASFDGTGSDFTRAGSDGGSNISFSTSSPIGVFWDADNDKVGVMDGDAGEVSTNTLTNTHSDIPSYPIGFLFGCSDSSSVGTVRVNFGADPTFAGGDTSGTSYTTDAGGNATGGSFRLKPPDGYKALKTDNISTTSATTFSYVGNQSTDGPFVYMGYRPSSVTIGGTDYEDGSYNPNDGIDWLANGIKIRTSDTTINESGTSYSITAAPKELDFKYGTAR